MFISLVVALLSGMLLTIARAQVYKDLSNVAHNYKSPSIQGLEAIFLIHIAAILSKP